MPRPKKHSQAAQTGVLVLSSQSVKRPADAVLIVKPAQMAQRNLPVRAMRAETMALPGSMSVVAGKTERPVRMGPKKWVAEK